MRSCGLLTLNYIEMKELFEKYKISHLNKSDGKVFMIHENALEDIAKEYITEQLRLDAVAGRSEQLVCKHCDSKKELHSETTGLCPDRLKHFEAK